MNTPDKPSMLQRSTTVRCVRSLFTRRALRRELIVLAWFVTLLALFHGEETWRGRRAWNRCRRELEAQGMPLDFAALVPKSVPDDQNFAATPVVKSWFERKPSDDSSDEWGDNYWRVAECISSPKAKDAKGERHFLDLGAWEAGFLAARSGEDIRHLRFHSDKLDAASRSNAAPAVLEGLKTNEALFAELRAVSPRPYSRYPVNYDVETPYTILLPHLRRVSGICKRLQLKACAELAGGHSDPAVEDLRLMFRLADSVREEPFLISYLVRLACTQHAVQPIWEGLAEQRWSEAQLQELERRLQHDNFIDDLKTPLATERAGAMAAVELIRRKGFGYLFAQNDLTYRAEPPLPGRRGVVDFFGWVLVPQGWYDLEKLNYCRDMQLELGTGVDAASKRVFPAEVKAGAQACEADLQGSRWPPALRHRLLAQILLPALGRVIQKSAASQTAVNQAAIACALERYRMANGRFPEKLAALTPQLIAALPNDVLTGEPYKYRLTEDGRFVLYSVGWDEKDDGGVPGKALFGDKEGDWVWEYPAK